MSTKQKPIVDDIKSAIGKVRIYLGVSTKNRDDDERLVARFWADELLSEGIDPKTITAHDLLVRYATGSTKLTSADVITRARRKVQEKYPELRGVTWHERHGQAEDVRKNINKEEDEDGK